MLRYVLRYVVLRRVSLVCHTKPSNSNGNQEEQSTGEGFETLPRGCVVLFVVCVGLSERGISGWAGDVRSEKRETKKALLLLQTSDRSDPHFIV